MTMTVGVDNRSGVYHLLRVSSLPYVIARAISVVIARCISIR